MNTRESVDVEKITKDMEGLNDDQVQALSLLKTMEALIIEGKIDGFVAVGVNQKGHVFSGHTSAVFNNYFSIIGGIEDYKLYLQGMLDKG